MEAIHGITFIDYAATCAFMVQGKEIEELLPTLGVEKPQWEEANDYWVKAMREDQEFKLVTILGEVYQNPAQGKFAGAQTQTSEDVLEKIPTLEKFIEVMEMQSVAASYGVDAQAYLKEQGISLMDYSQASMYWMNVQNQHFNDHNAPGYNDFIHWFSATHQYYKEKYEQLFAAQNGGRLADGIEF